VSAHIKASSLAGDNVPQLWQLPSERDKGSSQQLIEIVKQ